MTKRFYKHKILFDEDVHYRSYFPKLNSLFDIKHITEDYHQVGLKDPQVYDYARRLGRTLVTFNSSDFRELAQTSNEIGVVGVTGTMPTMIIDKKLTALFRKASKKALCGKLTTITGETVIATLEL